MGKNTKITKKYAVIEEQDGNVHVRPVIDGEVIDTPIDTVIDYSKVETSIVFDENHKAIDYKGRGFETLEDAFAFVEKPYFKGLGQADQDEYIKWLY